MGSGADRKDCNPGRTTHGQFATMAAAENNVELKRKAEDEQAEEEDGEGEDWVGPMPSEATKAKKRKGSFPVASETSP